MGENPIDRRSIVKARMAVVAFLVLGAIALGVVIGVVAAGDGPPKNQPMPAQVITVSGGATVQTEPDKATVTLGVNTQADTPEDALKQNSALSDAVMKSLKADGVAEEDIQTTNVSLNKRIQDRGTPKEHSFYVAENQLTVIIRDLTQVGNVIGDAVDAGANDVRGVEFGLESSTSSKSRALTQAVQNARIKAQTLAKAAGVTLGPVVRIDEQRYDVNNYQYRGQALMAFDAAVPAASPMPIAAGQVETSVALDVVFELEQ